MEQAGTTLKQIKPSKIYFQAKLDILSLIEEHIFLSTDLSIQK